MVRGIQFIFLFILLYVCSCSKTCLKGPLKKKTKIGFQDRLSLNAGQKYCRMLQGEHSAILSTFIKLPFSLISLFCLFLRGFTACTPFCHVCGINNKILVEVSQ